jgi:ribosomal protein S18 acetylase RimI-like enzyme
MKVQLAEYESTDAQQVTAIWRSSFQRAMGLSEADFPDDFDQHARFLNDQVAVDNQLFLMKDRESGQVLAFMAINGDSINHLYVHTDFQGQGLGTRLLNLAKESSSGQLSLYTFRANSNARQFYEKHGFIIHARGSAELSDNPWAKDVSQLEDIEFHWQR